MNRPLPGAVTRRPIYDRPARHRPRRLDYFVVGGDCQILPLRMAYRALRKAGCTAWQARKTVYLLVTTRGEVA